MLLRCISSLALILSSPGFMPLPCSRRAGHLQEAPPGEALVQRQEPRLPRLPPPAALLPPARLRGRGGGGAGRRTPQLGLLPGRQSLRPLRLQGGLLPRCCLPRARRRLLLLLCLRRGAHWMRGVAHLRALAATAP